jgi:hypothetical protein
MGRCKDCRYWDKSGGPRLDYDAWGECLRVKDRTEWVNIRAVGYDVQGVVTYPDFGCTEFAPKEAE